MILLDPSLADLRWPKFMADLDRICPGLKIMILSMDKDPEYLHQALAQGASGYLLKEDVAAELSEAIDTIRQGDIYRPSWYRPEMPGTFARRLSAGRSGRSDNGHGDGV